MIALHTSDSHGNYKDILDVVEDFHVWIDTGDFFPNCSRQLGQSVQPHREMEYQSRWCGYKDLGNRLVKWLDGRPLISCPGNHDFISLARVVEQAGGETYTVTPEGFVYRGFYFAGFREINYIHGQWAGEVMDFGEMKSIVEATMSSEPDILITHAPPAGVLDNDGKDGYGIGALYTELFYGRHRIEQHFFGHVHEQGGQSTELDGIKFHNGATAIVLHEID